MINPRIRCNYNKIKTQKNVFIHRWCGTHEAKIVLFTFEIRHVQFFSQTLLFLKKMHVVAIFLFNLEMESANVLLVEFSIKIKLSAHRFHLSLSQTQSKAFMTGKIKV
jgi:hypothetical protein